MIRNDPVNDRAGKLPTWALSVANLSTISGCSKRFIWSSLWSAACYF